MTVSGSATKVFGEDDQEFFAALSGDRNPMHMDAVAARRTIAGFRVVHGIHTLLWCLEQLFRSLAPRPCGYSIGANFEKLVYVGDKLTAVFSDADGTMSIYASVGEIRVMSARLTPSEIAKSIERPLDADEHPNDLVDPIELSFEQMSNCGGRFAAKATDFKLAFPAACAALGEARVAELAATSYLVGMICPGLHSIYSSLKLRPTQSAGAGMLGYKVSRHDERFRYLRLDIDGSGWTGSLEAHARPEPRLQPQSNTLAHKIKTDEFVGVSALVIGGSRGLGEFVAKSIAAGGGTVTITYAVGEADALRVQRDIEQTGGVCAVIKLNVRDAKISFPSLRYIPNQLYFMASPPIFRRAGSGFNIRLFEEFINFYVTSFYNTLKYFKGASRGRLVSFYPSSVAVIDRPPGMTEYAMAKAAGEILCADMQSEKKLGLPIIVHRLPRLATDQTASLRSVEEEDTLAVIHPILVEMLAKTPHDEAT